MLCLFPGLEIGSVFGFLGNENVIILKHSAEPCGTEAVTAASA